MTNAAKISYTLVFGLLSLTGCSRAMKPVDHQPVADLVSALKSDGQVRIAQGYAGVLGKDAGTGKLSIEQVPLMVTTNKDTQEWTVSVIQGQTLGSTWLIGGNLHSSSGDVPNLPDFDRDKVAPDPFYPDEVKSLAAMGYQSVYRGAVTSTMGAALDMAAAYRQQEIDANVVTLTVNGEQIDISQGELRKVLDRRVDELERKREALGDSPDARAKESSGPDFHNMKPLFADVLTTANGAFCVLVVDQEGRCATIAEGDAFSEKR